MAMAKRRDAGARPGEGGLNSQLPSGQEVRTEKQHSPLGGPAPYNGYKHLCENSLLRPVYRKGVQFGRSAGQ